MPITNYAPNSVKSLITMSYEYNITNGFQEAKASHRKKARNLFYFVRTFFFLPVLGPSYFNLKTVLFYL